MQLNFRLVCLYFRLVHVNFLALLSLHFAGDRTGCHPEKVANADGHVRRRCRGCSWREVGRGSSRERQWELQRKKKSAQRSLSPHCWLSCTRAPSVTRSTSTPFSILKASRAGAVAVKPWAAEATIMLSVAAMASRPREQRERGHELSDPRSSRLFGDPASGPICRGICGGAATQRKKKWCAAT